MQRIIHFFHRDKNKSKQQKEDTNFTMKVFHYMDASDTVRNYTSQSLNMKTYQSSNSDEIAINFRAAAYQCSPAGEVDYQKRLETEFAAIMPGGAMMQRSRREVTSRRSEIVVYGKIKGCDIETVEFASIEELADLLNKHHIKTESVEIKAVENVSRPRLG